MITYLMFTALGHVSLWGVLLQMRKLRLGDEVTVAGQRLWEVERRSEPRRVGSLSRPALCCPCVVSRGRCNECREVEVCRPRGHAPRVPWSSGLSHQSAFPTLDESLEGSGGACLCSARLAPRPAPTHVSSCVTRAGVKAPGRLDKPGRKAAHGGQGTGCTPPPQHLPLSEIHPAICFAV